MVVETKEERTIFGTVDVVQFVFAGHGRIRFGHRKDHTEVSVLFVVHRRLVDAITAVMITSVAPILMVMSMPMMMPVQSRLMIRGRAGRGTAVKGVDASCTVSSLWDTTPVPLRTFDIRTRCVVRRAANCGRRRTRRKRQCCQVLIVL